MANYKNGYCNGIRQSTSRDPEFIRDLEYRAFALHDTAKSYIKTLRDDSYLFGERFNDPANIVARAAGTCTQSCDDITRDNFVMAAFIDAASADWYYAHEKEW